MNASPVLGIDVGVENIVVSIAERDEEGTPRIIGFGSSPSKGFRDGSVVHYANASKSVRRAIFDARRNTGVNEDGETILSFGSYDALNLVSSGTVSLTARGRNIAKEDESRAVAAAYRNIAKSLPSDYTVIHAFPISSSVDGKEGIASPSGMFGSTMSSEVLFIAVPSSALLNTANCVMEHVKNLAGLVFNPLSTSLGVLRSEDFTVREGSIFAHIGVGSGASTLSVFSGESPLRLASIPLGGDILISKLADSFEISLEDAERVAKTLGRRGATQPVSDPSRIEEMGAVVEEISFGVFSIMAEHISDISPEKLPGGVYVSGNVDSSSPYILSGFGRAFEGYSPRTMPRSPEHPLAMFSLSEETSIDERCDFTAAAGAVRYLESMENEGTGFFDPTPDMVLGPCFAPGRSKERTPLARERRAVSPFSGKPIVRALANAVRDLF